MFVVCVDFRIHPERLDEFLPLMLANADASVADEDGCARFDVCQNPTDPAAIFLYEVYNDAAAFEAHKATAHYARFAKATAPMVASKSVRTYRLLET